jgi:hypothetical protein
VHLGLQPTQEDEKPPAITVRWFWMTLWWFFDRAKSKGGPMLAAKGGFSKDPPLATSGQAWGTRPTASPELAAALS